MRARSAVIIAAITIGTGLTGAGVAAAQPSTPVTITLSPEQVTAICQKRIPRIEQRVGRLVERINGGAEVKGSAAWLRARADKEQAAGRGTSATLLREKADRRAGRVDQLTKAKQRAEEFKGKYCGSK
ncbi:hypothetical protein [Actinokineospora globicatena]|uniref:Uncharacterized protein n=1 Tax=Actinokineospora globicatena TaxID=103729 RepID=A0A9W6V774_9PSEU|nr:hypothetical protein [Actinokineospora globicatena]MCP2301566.1 hypothetical protein [Actinokineospora globicatena]GLW76783.1 hypothetical protein Aglo01_12650 [Actinokineospora globicatena]GLW83616.1 hypothetical protein Aglo02_12560 [Actinokineospora globicatena]GLW92435.1 hypothetical protein Aglo03_32510 [Actinokineospora globicatena]